MLRWKGNVKLAKAAHIRVAGIFATLRGLVYLPPYANHNFSVTL